VKLRTRLALILAVCLLAAGSVALFASEAAQENAILSDYGKVQAQLIGQTGVSLTVVEQYLRQHPESIIKFDFNARILSHHRSLNDVFRAIQKAAQDHAIARSRRIGFLVLGGLALVVGIAGWLIARRILRPAHIIAERARAASASDLTQRVSLRGPDDEMKELSDTFDDMLSRLERSFAAQRRFAAQVSHELRTPLSVIRAEAELLDDQNTRAEHHQAVDTIREAAEHSQHLIDALLAMSRSESGNLDMRSVGLDEIVGDALTKAVDAGSFDHVRVDAELTATQVMGDRGLLECVAFNLIDNAARHNDAGGWARIAVRPDPEAGTWGLIEVANSTSDEHALAVPSGTTARLEGRGRQSPKPHGHGIGLSVVRSVIDAHGGRVDFGPDDGIVTVTVRLPVGAGERVGAGPAPWSAEPTSSG
jgi:signal transduction histidine kinase